MREVGGSSPSSPIRRTSPRRSPKLPMSNAGHLHVADFGESLRVARGRMNTATRTSMTLTLSPSPASDLVGIRRGPGASRLPVPLPDARAGELRAVRGFLALAGRAGAAAGRGRRGGVPLPDPGSQPGPRREPRAIAGQLHPAGRRHAQRHARPISGRRRRGGLPRSAGHAGPAGGARGVLRLHHDGRGGRLRGFGHGAAYACHL